MPFENHRFGYPCKISRLCILYNIVITIWTTILVVFQSDKELTKPTNMLRNQQHAHWTQQRPTNINRWFSSKETVAGNLSIRWRIFRVKELGAPESWLEVGGFKTHLVPNKKVPFLYIAHLQLLGILETTLKPPRTFAAPCFTQTIVLRPKHLWSSHQLRNPKRPAPIYCVFQQKKWPQLSSEHGTALSPLGCHSSRSPPRHNEKTVDASSIQTPLGLPDFGGMNGHDGNAISTRLFPRLGKRRTHMASWILIEWHPSKHLQEMYGDVVFFSKLASSRPKFPKTPTRKSCHTEEFGFKKRSQKKWKHLPLSKFSSLISSVAFWTLFFVKPWISRIWKIASGIRSTQPIYPPPSTLYPQRLVLRRAVRKGSKASSTKYFSGYLAPRKINESNLKLMVSKRILLFQCAILRFQKI